MSSAICWSDRRAAIPTAGARYIRRSAKALGTAPDPLRLSCGGAEGFSLSLVAVRLLRWLRHACNGFRRNVGEPSRGWVAQPAAVYRRGPPDRWRSMIGWA